MTGSAWMCGKAWGADAHAVGDVQAVRDGKIAVLPLGRLDGGIGFPLGGRHAPGAVDEMVDQGLDVLQGVRLLGQHIAVIVRDPAAVGHPVHGLRHQASDWRISSMRTR